MLTAENIEAPQQKIAMLKRCIDIDYNAIQPRAELAMALADEHEYEQAEVIFSVVRCGGPAALWGCL